MGELRVKKVNGGYKVWRTKPVRKGKHMRIRGADGFVTDLQELKNGHKILAGRLPNKGE